MQPLRRGATGSAVAEVRAHAGLARAARQHRPGAPATCSTRPPSSRSGTSSSAAASRSTASSAPRPTRALTGAHWRLGDRVLAHEPGQRSTATTSPRCRPSCSSSATTWPAPTACSGSRPPRALRSFQRDYGLSPTASAARRPCARCASSAAASSAADRSCCARWSRSPPPARACSASGSSSIPGHGGDDPGVVDDGDVTRGRAGLGPRRPPRGPAHGARRADLAHPRAAQRRAPTSERAALANEVGADLVLSLHVDGFASPRANGVAAYYYGAGESASTIGERLADLVQRELVARTGLPTAASTPRPGRCCG